MAHSSSSCHLAAGRQKEVDVNDAERGPGPAAAAAESLHCEEGVRSVRIVKHATEICWNRVRQVLRFRRVQRGEGDKSSTDATL